MEIRQVDLWSRESHAWTFEVELDVGKSGGSDRLWASAGSFGHEQLELYRLQKLFSDKVD